MNTNPYEINSKPDLDARQLIYYVTKADPVDPNISLIAGDAIQNLRSALDHMIWSLVRSPGTHTGFPITDELPITKKQKGAVQRKIQGLRPDAIDLLRIVKPYKGGDDRLWRLHQLNIIDKHELWLQSALRLRL